MPIAAAMGWVIITRDLNIRRNPAERRAVRENGAKVVALSGEDAKNTWGHLGVLMRHWRAIEESATDPGPFIRLATRRRLTALDLDR